MSRNVCTVEFFVYFLSQIQRTLELYLYVRGALIGDEPHLGLMALRILGIKKITEKFDLGC